MGKRLHKKKKVTFKDLVDNSNMKKLYGYYKLSSSYIHGNHKANVQSLGVIPNLEKIHLSGASNYGLSIPIQNVAISLSQISTFFLLTYSNSDVRITILIMKHFLDKIMLEANKAQEKIESKQKKLRKIYSNVLITAFKEKNSSSRLLDEIRANNVDKLKLTNSFITSEKELKNKIIKENYKYIILFGEQNKDEVIYIELTAKNKYEHFKSTFLYDDLKSYFNSNDITAYFSNNIETPLFNTLYYKALEFISINHLDTQIVFIQIPSYKSNFDFDNFSKVISNFIISLDKNPID